MSRASDRKQHHIDTLFFLLGETVVGCELRCWSSSQTLFRTRRAPITCAKVHRINGLAKYVRWEVARMIWRARQNTNSGSIDRQQPERPLRRRGAEVLCSWLAGMADMAGMSKTGRFFGMTGCRAGLAAQRPDDEDGIFPKFHREYQAAQTTSPMLTLSLAGSEVHASMCCYLCRYI
jgi:hypothetical protein